MNGDIELQVFEAIDIESCIEAECEYLNETPDPYNTGDSWYIHYECTGGPEICPILAKKVQDYVEDLAEVDDE